MNFKGIDKWSWKYQLTRFYVKLAHNTIFYRKVCVTGKENLPENCPLFFAPNHQNALMDALIILCNIKKQPVFIARADIFKNPIIAKILIFLKILPAYRIRDGKENLGKNEEIFDIAVNILENKNILTLFPETTHTDKRKLQILKKGVQRIVFQAEEKNNFQLGVKIVPIGINFSNYWNFKSDILINFGKPIDLSEFNEIYKVNQQKAMLALRDRLTDEIIPLIIDIQHVDYYDLFDYLREIYGTVLLKMRKQKTNMFNKFKAQKEIIAILEKKEKDNHTEVDDIKKAVDEYREILKINNIRDWVIRKNNSILTLSSKSLLLILSFPVFFYGWLNHVFPYYLPNPLRKKIKDRQFLSSVNFVAGLVLYPVFYLIQFILVWIFCKIWWFKFIYLITLPFTGIAAFYFHRSFIKLKSQWKYHMNRKKSWAIRLMDLKNEIDNKMFGFISPG